jgi:hypothetical protein
MAALGTRVVLGSKGVSGRLREVGMLRAVFVRTLKPGVRYEQFVDAWMPQDLDGEYAARVSVSRNVADDRQVITILELDMSMTEFETRRATLTRPDALERLGEIVATTELAGTTRRYSTARLYDLRVFSQVTLLNSAALRAALGCPVLPR